MSCANGKKKRINPSLKPFDYNSLMVFKHNKQKKSQSGRSMIEMLGVLAIVGVLSVGALAGYSLAMANYKANQAVDEIKEAIFNTQELFEGKSYDDISFVLLIKAGILPNDLKNLYGARWGANGSSASTFQISYGLPDGSDTECKKILTSGFENEFGQNLAQIDVYNGDGALYRINWTGISGSGATFPITIDTAVAACDILKGVPDNQIMFFITK
jgi:type II secretory pathway pseudopilin PulG